MSLGVSGRGIFPTLLAAGGGGDSDGSDRPGGWAWRQWLCENYDFQYKPGGRLAADNIPVEERRA